MDLVEAAPIDTVNVRNQGVASAPITRALSVSSVDRLAQFQEPLQDRAPAAREHVVAAIGD